ncbi:MAG: response regulator [Flavitalea sp.]
MEPIHVLLVEDNEGDILLTKEAFEQSKILINLSVVKDGKEAVDFVLREGKYINVQLPDLLLLDINLPKKNGIEVLKFIKGNESIKQIPVIMLTTSSFENDIVLSYKNYASCYITKPVDTDNFLTIISKIEDFWISIVKLPAKKTP